ncbi:MAG: hypothetical protein LBD96_01770 [Treponema sp.]|jgi:hypothetical protein|nr:hypothetical protein [Treponema sp.]
MNIIRFDQFRLPHLRRRRIRLLAAILFPLILAAGVFLCRSPVLFVSDAGFDAIYGFRRTLTGQIGLSLRLFRRVKRLVIAENANPEAMVFAIEEKEKRPWAVLGHSRYSWGLSQYARQRADVRVIIIGEDSALLEQPVRSDPSPGGGDVELVFSDLRLNSWRLGRCAALLAGETDGTVLVFQDRQNFPVEQEAFLAGLREERENLVPLYLDPSVDYSSWEQVRCVVLAGPSESYLRREQEIPCLLYSWMDPALSPSSVRIVADDSPWALAFQALRVPSGGDAALYRTVPAAFSIPWGRVGNSGLRGRLKKALVSQIPQDFL